MPRTVDNARTGARVNVLKKVKTSTGWRLCPVVHEANGRLRDRVRVNGDIQIHLRASTTSSGARTGSGFARQSQTRLRCSNGHG